MTAFKARWNGEGWELPLRSQLVCARNFKPGDSIWLTELEESSPESRGQYFAVIRNAWQNLPDQWGNQFENPTILRKWALIRAKFYMKKQIACDSLREAKRWRAIFAAQVRNMEDYAEIGIKGNVVVILTAETQKTRVMGKRRFQESKQAVIEILATMLRVSVEQLMEESRKQAA